MQNIHRGHINNYGYVAPFDYSPANTGAIAMFEVLSKEDEALLEQLARELPVALGLPPAGVSLVFDSDRRAIYAGKTRAETRKCQARPARANDRLATLAAGNDMHVIDSYPVFQRYSRERLGPLDRTPVDAHWNAAAHRLMAQEVARIIER